MSVRCKPGSLLGAHLLSVLTATPMLEHSIFQVRHLTPREVVGFKHEVYLGFKPSPHHPLPSLEQVCTCLFETLCVPRCSRGQLRVSLEVVPWGPLANLPGLEQEKPLSKRLTLQNEAG